jgi:hypothetical protein
MILWNRIVGYNPFQLNEKSFIRLLSIVGPLHVNPSSPLLTILENAAGLHILHIPTHIGTYTSATITLPRPILSA